MPTGPYVELNLTATDNASPKLAPLTTPTLAELAERFGRWHTTEDDAEITVPPYWTRGADHDDPSGAAGTAYVIPAEHNADLPGWDVAQRGAVTEWTRVIQTTTEPGAPTVTITGDDTVEVVGNDVRTVRGPAQINVGSFVRLTPLHAMRLITALAEAVQLVTDLENAHDVYTVARKLDGFRDVSGEPTEDIANRIADRIADRVRAVDLARELGIGPADVVARAMFGPAAAADQVDVPVDDALHPIRATLSRAAADRVRVAARSATRDAVCPCPLTAAPTGDDIVRPADVVAGCPVHGTSST